MLNLKSLHFDREFLLENSRTIGHSIGNDKFFKETNGPMILLIHRPIHPPKFYWTQDSQDKVAVLE